MNSRGETNFEIETARLLLRLWKDEDLDPYARMCADPVVMRYMRTGVMTREQTKEQISMLARHWEKHGHGLWAVEEKASGRFIGRIGLMYREDWPEGDHKVDAGWLIDRSCWGRGFATEGALASLRWGFEELGEERILAMKRRTTSPRSAWPRSAGSPIGAKRVGDTSTGIGTIAVAGSGRPAIEAD